MSESIETYKDVANYIKKIIFKKFSKNIDIEVTKEVNTEKSDKFCIELNNHNLVLDTKDEDIISFVKRRDDGIKLLDELVEEKENHKLTNFILALYKEIPNCNTIREFMKVFQDLSFQHYQFDMIACVSYEDIIPPKKIEDATLFLQHSNKISKKQVDEMLEENYPENKVVHDILLKNNIVYEQTKNAFPKTESFKKYFQDFIMIPFNEQNSEMFNFIIVLNSRESDPINTDIISQLQSIQTQTLMSLQNKKLTDNIKNSAKNIKKFQNLTKHLNKLQNFDDAISKTSEELNSFFKADIGCYYQFNHFTKNMEISFKCENNILPETIEWIEKENISKINDKTYQILIPINAESKKYIFLIETKSSKFDELKEIESFLPLVTKTITKLVENIVMHQEIREINKVLLKDKEELAKDIYESNKRSYNIIDNMDESVIAINEDFKIILFNIASEELFKINKEDVLGNCAKDFIEKWKLPVESKAKYRSINLEYNLNDKTFRLKKRPYSTKDKKQGLVLILEDITKQKEIEEIKNEFISVLSHEIKTPLTSMTGFTKLLLNERLGELNPNQKESIEVIYNESIRLKNLVEDMLDIKKLEKGKLQIHKSKVNIIDLYDDIIDNNIFLKNKKIKIIKEFNHIDREINIDSDKIKQVVINLISNAIKFTDDNGSITIKVEEKNNELVTHIIDTGIGIKQEELDHIFDKFYQVEDHLVRNEGGTGLGLAIVKKIVEHHNGHIEVKSKFRKGSDFTFFIPFE